MSALFEQAIPIILAHEGGYVNDPDDPGGETNFGLTRTYLLGLPKEVLGSINVSDMRGITQTQAEAIYQTEWWNKYSLGDFEQPIANKIFDLAVNMGYKEVAKNTQRAIQALGVKIVVDGDLGPASRKIINTLNTQKLLDEIGHQTVVFYQGLVAKNPKLRKFLNGWIRRALS